MNTLMMMMTILSLDISTRVLLGLERVSVVDVLRADQRGPAAV